MGKGFLGDWGGGETSAALNSKEGKCPNKPCSCLCGRTVAGDFPNFLAGNTVFIIYSLISKRGDNFRREVTKKSYLPNRSVPTG